MEKPTKREKVLLALTVVSIGTAGYFGFKYHKTLKDAEELHMLLGTVLSNGTENFNIKVMHE